MKLKNIKALIIAVLGVAAIGVASFNAFARPAYGYEKTYYSDAAHTEYAGSATLMCSGLRVSDGVVTPYFDQFTFKC